MGQASSIVYRKVSSLQPLENNPRTIDRKAFLQLCSSIQSNPEHFNARPLILSNRTGKLVVIAGNMRLQAAKDLGFDEVPTYLIKGLTEEKEREIIIRDNVNNGEWDFDTIANEWDVDLVRDWGVEIKELKLPRENTSSVKGKIRHECPSCGHTWIKADD